jgi:lysosomal alpha-glucosidase
MSSEKDWTYDLDRYSKLPEIVQDLHVNGQHYINIIDPAISTTIGYEPYDTGLKYDIFIKEFNSSKPLVGKVWPGETVFPDFTHSNASNWWSYLANKYHKNITFDGLWIDMNEPSNFVSGSINGCTNNQLDNPSYIPSKLILG